MRSFLLFALTLLAGHATIAADSNALALTQTGHFAFATEHPSLDLASDGSDFTIEGFFHLQAIAENSTRTFLSKPQAYEIEIFLNTNGIAFVYFNIWSSPGSKYQLSIGTQIQPGLHHIAGVVRNVGTQTVAEIYLDGFRLRTNAIPGATNSTQPVFVGGGIGTAGFQGWIDEVRFSSTARYGTDLYSIPGVPFAVDTDTRSLWHFNEPSGSTSFNDASGNANTLFGTNGALTALLPVDSIAGSIDRAFNPGVGAQGEFYPQGVYAVATETNGKVIIAGQFDVFNGVPHTNLARLFPTGVLDTNFNPQIGHSFGPPTIEALAIQTNGQILIAGNFETVNGVGRTNFARLNSNGTLDTTFTTLFTPSFYLNGLVILPSGKILVTGSFNVGTTPNRRRDIARLNFNGSLDLSFNAVTVSGFIERVLVQSNQQILISGFFASINGESRDGLARLTSDGALDLGFAPRLSSADSAPWPKSMALQPDERILLAGSFTHVNGTICYGAARLNTNGTTDPSFMIGRGSSDEFRQGGRLDYVLVQPDGKSLFNGVFIPQMGIGALRLARFNSDGSLDLTFRPVQFKIPNSKVYAHSLNNNGNLIVGGEFSDINGIQRKGIARLLGDPIHAPRLLSITSLGGGVLRLDVTNPASLALTLQSTTNPASFVWQSVATNSAATNQTSFLRTNLPMPTARFYRALLLGP